MVFSLLTSGGFALNDFCDRERDEVTHPDRVIPQRRMSPRSALTISTVHGLLAIALSLGVDVGVAILAAITAGLLYVYSTRVKGSGRIDSLANPIAALVCANTILVAAFLGGEVLIVFCTALLLFVFVTAREILLDVRDLPSDSRFGLRTIPILLGEERAIRAASVGLVVFACMSPFLLISPLFGVSYLILISIADLVVLSGAVRLLLSPCRQEAIRVAGDLRWALAAGVLSLLFSGLA